MKWRLVSILWRVMLGRKYIVKWSFSVSLRLFSVVYEGKYNNLYITINF